MNAYQKHLQNRQKEKLIDLELPSGMIWKVRSVNLQQWIIAGRLPLTLMQKMGELDGKPLSEQMKGLSASDVTQSLEFMRDILLAACVEPKLSLKPQNENEIAPEELLPEDFEALVKFCMSGGEESPNSFRPARTKRR